MARTTANTATVQSFDAHAYLMERIAARKAESNGATIAERITNATARAVKGAAYHVGKAGERIATGAPDIWAAGRAVGEAQSAADVKRYVDRAAREIEEALAQ